MLRSRAPRKLRENRIARSALGFAALVTLAGSFPAAASATATDPLLRTGRVTSASPATSSGAILIKDIDPGPASAWSSSTAPPVKVDGTIFFGANDGVHWNILWKTDGTRATTEIVRPDHPVHVAYDPGSIAAPIASNGRLYFVGGAIRGPTLWRSDGTPSGTRPIGTFPGTIANLVDVRGTVYFTAGDRQLWKVDGRKATLVMSVGTDAGISSLTNVHGTLFLVSSARHLGPELWRTTTSGDGTRLVRDLVTRPGVGSDPNWLTPVGQTLFFTARRGVTGDELYESDGTKAGTVLVKDIVPGPTGSFPSNLVESGGRLFFTDCPASPQHYCTMLWTSDGTAGGTVPLSAEARDPTGVDGTLFFFGGGAPDSLWRSDGSIGGTVQVRQLNGGYGLTAVGATAFMSARAQTLGVELWRSDGTKSGTRLVDDINPGQPSSYPVDLTAGRGSVFFWANDGVHGVELWKSTPP